MAGKLYLLSQVACGGAYTFWAYPAFLSENICQQYIHQPVSGDDQPCGTMHSSPKSTTTGKRDTGPTTLLRPISE